VNVRYSALNDIIAAKQRLISAAILAIVPVILIYVYAYRPDSSIIYPRCPLYMLTGVHCPGCGTLRGLNQLLHGNILAAIDLNPLMILSLPGLCWAYLSQCSITIKARPLPQFFLSSKWIWTLLGIILIFWILRNIPIYPLTYLAP